MPSTTSLTLNEAGYVVGQTARAINRAIDRENLRVGLAKRGDAALRMIGPAELRYLAISGEVAKDLTPAARRRLYEAVRRLPVGMSVLELGVMTFHLDAIDRGIAERLARLTALQAGVEERPGADPVIRSTRATVYGVAALLRERSTAEVLAAFPGLTAAQVETARDYAAVYPRPGRPPPERGFKQMLADMAGSGVWDVQDDEPIAPHAMP